MAAEVVEGVLDVSSIPTNVENEVADVVIGAALVVDVEKLVHLQTNQSPLLNCEYSWMLVPFDK